MKKLIVATLFMVLAGSAFGQINARLMRYMDISDTQIAFVYGGDVWLVGKEGGLAVQLTNSPGEESYPRFSPDGSEIAYTASYNGNEDIFVVPVSGGVPTRVTYQSHADRMVDWHPDGEHILFASPRASGTGRVRRFFLVDKEGGLPELLNVPYGEMASFSPDGNSIAYVTRLAEDRPFKRYRGGFSSDVYLYDLTDDSAVNITDSTAIDAKPVWIDDKIFFLSDQDANMRLNVWVYDLDEGSTSQVTEFTDFDISYLGASESDLVFAAGGDLYRMGTDDLELERVDVDVVSDLSAELPRAEDVSRRIANMTAAPGGTRVAFEARGELFDVPVEEGYSLNITQSSGAFDHNPAWSPDRRWIAYWSDASGEYEIHLHAVSSEQSSRQLTSRGKGYGYALYWSPDSSKLSFIDETNTIYVVDVDSARTSEVAKNLWNLGHGSRYGYPIAWSPDSRWLTFALGQQNTHSAIYIYDSEEGDLRQVTSGFYSDLSPIFSAGGQYLFFLTNRNFDAVYSDLDQTWVYPNATQLAAISLDPSAPSLLPVKNDAVAFAVDEDAEAEESESESEKEPAEELSVSIDFTAMEARIELLPPQAGNIGPLMPFEGKVVYVRRPNSGSAEEDARLVFYDIEEQEEKTILADVDGVVATADHSGLLVESNNRYGIVSAEPEQRIEDAILPMGW